MFSLCSVPSTCLQNAISSSAKTARPRRGALNITYGRPVLRLPGSRRALGLAKQGLKSHCKRRSGQSRCRENMDLPLLTMWLLQRNIACPLSHCIQYKDDTGSDPLSYCMQLKALHYAAASAIRPHRTTFVEPRQDADFRSRAQEEGPPRLARQL